MCLGTIFTNDVVIHHFGEKRFNDRQRVLMARLFIVAIVTFTYLLSLLEAPLVFDLGVWCFSGFASLFPLVFAAVYWRGVTKAGAIASILATAAVWGVLFYRDMILGHGSEEELLIYGMMPVTIIFASSLVSLVVVSLFTKPPSKATIDKFFLEKVSRA
jgi:SSS family solute:Na+ symporter